MAKVSAMNKKYIKKLRETNVEMQGKFKESASKLAIAEKALTKARLNHLDLLGDLNTIGLTLRNLGASEV